MDFESAESFYDLVEANLHFLCGDLHETPVHCGPLDPESSDIFQQLFALCEDANVVTTCSQPARRKPKQREFVDGMWEGKLDDFVNVMRTQDVYFVAAQHGTQWSQSIISDKDIFDSGYLSLTPKNGTGICVHDFVKDNLYYAQMFDTEAYKVSTDPEIVTFCVADKKFGMPTGQCCEKLRTALKSVM